MRPTPRSFGASAPAALQRFLAVPQRDFVDCVYRRLRGSPVTAALKGVALSARCLAWRAGSIFLLLSGGQETGHKHDENSGQPQDFGRNAGDHELRTSNNIDSADVNNEQKMR
jgi:hypothetical protein